MNYLYNGVELPALPEWNKETYPYAMLIIQSSDGKPYSAMLYVTADITHGYNKNGVWSVPSSGYFGWFDDDPTTWNELTLSGSNPAVDLIDWANFDVLNEDGTLYLAASEPIPVKGENTMGDAFITRRGGGAGLNFKITGNPQPDNPRENTIWVDTDVPIHRWDFSAGNPHLVSKTKNLNCYPFYDPTRTLNGITFTDNGDGTVKANGTATADASFRLSFTGSNAIHLPAGRYFLSGCPAGGSSTGYRAEVKNVTTGETLATDYGTGAAFELDEPQRVRCNIVVAKGATASNLTFMPQLEKGTAATGFVKGDATGQLWVVVGTTSNVEFNTLAKNGVTVYPLAARQYIGGAWVDKTPMIYQRGQWRSWVVYLFNAGDQNEDITGGWSNSIDDASADSWSTDGNWPPAAANGGGISIGNTMVLHVYENTNLRRGAAAVGTRNAIDLTPYSKIKAVCSATQEGAVTSAHIIRLAINPTLETPQYDPIAYVDIPLGASEVELDVSQISGLYHIVIGGMHGQNGDTMRGYDLTVSAVSIE